MTPAPGPKALSTLMLLAVYWLAVPAWAADAVEVKIGAAHFPPYTVRPEQGADTGLLPQLVDA
ncbi:amino acid ABC transporter substrate-binding protein, partial [Pseudomonas sp. SIMBA_059]